MQNCADIKIVTFFGHGHWSRHCNCHAHDLGQCQGHKYDQILSQQYEYEKFSFSDSQSAGNRSRRLSPPERSSAGTSQLRDCCRWKILQYFQYLAFAIFWVFCTYNIFYIHLQHFQYLIHSIFAISQICTFTLHKKKLCNIFYTCTIFPMLKRYLSGLESKHSSLDNMKCQRHSHLSKMSSITKNVSTIRMNISQFRSAVELFNCTDQEERHIMNVRKFYDKQYI